MATANEGKAAAPVERGCQYERLPSPHPPGGQGYGGLAAGRKGEDADSSGAAVASKPLLRANSMVSVPSGVLPPGCAQKATQVVVGTKQEVAGPGMCQRGRSAACVVTGISALSVNLPWLGCAVAGRSACLFFAIKQCKWTAEGFGATRMWYHHAVCLWYLPCSVYIVKSTGRNVQGFWQQKGILPTAGDHKRVHECGNAV